MTCPIVRDPGDFERHSSPRRKVRAVELCRSISAIATSPAWSISRPARSASAPAGARPAAKYGHYEKPQLVGKNIALIFEKTSTRTRCAFEVAAHDQGAHVTYLGPHDSQIGHKESMKDTARVLSRFYDAIEFRGAGQELVDALVEYADVPIYNGLTNEIHPTQFLADALTMLEHVTSQPVRSRTATSATAASTPRTPC
jgi:ornithine carbamoyltransferase